MNHEITEILKSAGYPVVEGAENVKRMIRCASDGSAEKRCSGYRVFPDGTKCEGCSDCKPNKEVDRDE